MPADMLTKALPAVKFVAMLNLLGLGIQRPAVASVMWSKGALAVMILRLGLLLKGQDARHLGVAILEDSEAVDIRFWVWMISGIAMVVLSWEGLKSLVRMMFWRESFRAGEVATDTASPPPSVHSNPRPTREPIPPRQPPARRPAEGRIPANLEVFCTATGERWHQDPNCADIRTRITQRFLPCGRCTAEKHIRPAPPEPPVLPQHNPPPPPVRRRQPRTGS